MNVLITADIHIEDYASYNYEYRSRFNQFDILADRFIELKSQYNCDELWILGDLIDKPNSRPYVLHKAYQFISKLSNNFTTVRYILGNHDLDSKSESLTEIDSQITIFDQPNLIYMDRKLLECNGHKYGFMNWRPSQNLTWIGDSHLDILFGHYTKSDLFGQEIDDSKFDWMIHGDIHNSQVIGKFISVCNPLQKDMSSEQEGKVIIFNTDTMEWKRELTDPDHNKFLQISYTDDQSKEGFTGPLQYNIFKPKISIDQDDELEKALTWNDIDDLIDTACKEHGLQEIHSEISSKCKEFSEVDFNFQLLSLSIHGYRSIEDLDLNFTKGDRIALLGQNGSGKSSIIRALQGVFLKNSDLKYEQSDFTEDMKITVKLLYQNKIYEITKGSTWGLIIDGQEQSYHGIRDFELDLPVKLPFLNFLDLFFINSNVSNLSNKFNPTRRIELISKFYRLDRINAYNSTAIELLKSITSELNGIQSERAVKCGIQTHVNSRIKELEDLHLKTSDEYRSELDNYRELRVKNFKYLSWDKANQSILSEKSETENSLKTLTSKLSFDSNQGAIDLKDLKDKAATTNEVYIATYQKSIQFEKDLKELIEVENQGKVLKDKLTKLKTGRCPECDAPLELGKQNSLKKSYESDIATLRIKWGELDSKLSENKDGRESKKYYLDTLSNLKKAYTDLNNSIELLDNKLKNYMRAKSMIDAETKHLESITDKLNDSLNNMVEEIQLPITINELEETAITNLNKINELKTQYNDLNSITKEISDLDAKAVEVTSRYNNYNDYVELTSMTGVIYEEILRKLATKFSTTQVKYELDVGIFRGSRFINFNSYYLSKGTYRLYESCSDGQKIVCDLDFLEKLFSINIGLLTLDEYLKHLDDDNFSLVCDILTRMNVNTILLSTHDSNLTAYTRRIILSLDDIGKTIASII